MPILSQTSERHQVSIENLPNMRGYATADLWIQHPTKPYFWKMCVHPQPHVPRALTLPTRHSVGRKDDVIVHSSGEKTVPAPMEDILLSHPQCVFTCSSPRCATDAGVRCFP